MPQIFETMQIHVLQHVPFEGPAYIGQWAEEQNHRLTYTKFYDKWQLPPVQEFDWLIIMGGPMSVHDTCIYDWLMAEKTFVKNAIDAGKTVIGVCLGAQLISEVLGAEVQANAHTEIGWFPILKTVGASEHPFITGVPDTMDVFHWHGETFGIPQGATNLFSSEACANQGFIFDGRVVGLQFHLEATTESIEMMVSHGQDELQPSRYVQSSEEIFAGKSNLTQSNSVLKGLLNYLQNNTL